MKIQELRIGSFVFQFGEVSRIVQLDVGGKTYHRINDMQVHKSSLLTGGKICFEPIILTGDWLTNLGFCEIGKWIQPVYKLNGISLVCHENIWNTMLESFLGGYSLKNKVQYVHQLQNLYFSLTGQELEYQPS